jgi:hypothetical protein
LIGGKLGNYLLSSGKRNTAAGREEPKVKIMFVDVLDWSIFWIRGSDEIQMALFENDI